jgi:mono/diheme cytochrome c family protein
MRFWLIVLLAPCYVRAHDPVTTKLTWTQEISRIVHKRCASCHSAKGAIPLDTYENARPWAKAIKDEVLNRRMPPWGAVKGFGDFADDPSLTQSEITAIAEWVEGGAPEGDPGYLMPPTVARTASIPLKGRRVSALKGPATLLGIRPLQSTTDAQVVAHLPDGSTIPLLWLRDYKQSWNRTFVYRDPIALPNGTRIEATPPQRFQFLVR